MTNAANSIFLIYPYLHEGVWVFDDDRFDLVQEPFICGIPQMIDELVKDIPNAQNGFALFFSTNQIPGFQRTLTWIKTESNGNWYRCEETKQEGWLCPALLKYYAEAPKTIYVKTEPERVCNKFVIEGTIIDDSLQKGASFDAEPFFQQASFDDLKAMMLVGWGVDIVVDKVPQYIRTTNQEINKLLEVFESSPENEPGIDHVYNTILDENDVEKWLMQNRPEWHKQLIQILDKHLKRT